MTTAYLGLGSNLGDRAAALRLAVEALGHADGVDVVATSRVYETEPVGGPEQPPYLNAVVVVETTRGARELLELVKSIEVEAGREPDPARRVRFGPRELDIDVLLVDGDVIDEPNLQVPHPRIAERAFVLAPLEDVAPDLPLVREGRERLAGWPGVRVTDVELGS